MLQSVRQLRIVLFITLFCGFELCSFAFAGNGASQKPEVMLVDGKKAYQGAFLAKLAEGKSMQVAEMATDGVAMRCQKISDCVPSLVKIELTDDTSDIATILALKKLRASGLYEYVEPDWVIHLDAAPTDSSFTNGTLWGLRNTGQSGGVSGIDVNATSAWNIQTGSSSVVVAVIDTGIRYTHQDLADNMWQNPGEVANNGIDDDGNGYVDDVFGINSITGSGNPMDDNDHGTHCAGTIGAVANGGGSHVGVAWDVQLMALKFIASDGSGSTSDAIECIEYGISKGADIMSNSWGGGGYSQALRDVIQQANNAGILFVAAAGNESSNNDTTASYPANYTIENVISVAAIDRSGQLASFSNYGATMVDIAAPGVSIYSSVSSSDSSYDSFSGTSMATPHVAGVAALIVSEFPGISISELRTRLLQTASPLPSLAGRVVTGGMVDAYAALQSSEDGVLEVSTSSNGDLAAGANNEIFVTVTDLNPVTGATVQARFGSNSFQSLSDNGNYPDVTANDGVYSGSLPVPSGVSTTNLTVNVSASGYSSVSETFSFSVVAAPANDDFANRITLASGTTQTAGSSALATRESSEPTNPDVAGGKTVWWSWTAPSSGNVTISTTGSDFDTTLAIYTGSALSSLSLIGFNDDSTGLQSAVSFSAVSGVTYQIQVDGYAGETGTVQLNYPSPGSGQSPSIVTQPTGRGVLVGDSFTLAVTASGAAPLSYQWKLDNVNLPGETSSTYTVASATEANEGSYTVFISNNFGSITSNAAFVGVDPVSINPDNDNFADAALLSGASGRASSSNVRATGEFGEPDHAGSSAPLASVWWYWTAPSSGSMLLTTSGSDFDTTLAVYTGSTLASLIEVISGDDTDDTVQSAISFNVIAGTTYRIAVDGYLSSEGDVILNYTFAPEGGSTSNDDFANRTPFAGTIMSGSNIDATGESGEPSHAGVATPLASVWWSWTASTSSQVTLSTEGSDFDTVLAVYTGTSVASLSFVGSNDDTVDRQSEVTFFAVAGTSYAFVVDGYGSAEGTIRLTLDVDSGSDSFPYIVVQPNSLTVESGSPYRLSVSAVGASPLTYQWYLNGQPVGDSNSDSLEYVSANQSLAGSYNVEVSNNYGSVLSDTAVVSVQSIGGGPSNDNFADSSVIEGNSTVTGTNIGATSELNEPIHANVSSPSSSIWWNWTAPSAGQVTVRTSGSDFDTTLAVYSGDSLETLSEIGSNDDSNGTISEVVFYAVGGVRYSIAVDGYGDNQGNVRLALSFVETGVSDSWSSLFELGDNWYYSDWFGSFSGPISFNSWVYHYQHDWVYVVGPTEDNFWFWGSSGGWTWQSRSTAPWFYQVNTSTWYFLDVNSYDPLWFYSTGSGWFSVPRF